MAGRLPVLNWDLYPSPISTDTDTNTNENTNTNKETQILATGWRICQICLWDKYSWVLWQIQVSNRIDDVLSSIDINLTPARFRLKDVSDFLTDWRKKRNAENSEELNALPEKRCSFHSDVDQRWGIRSEIAALPIGNREKCENSVRDVAHRFSLITHFRGSASGSSVYRGLR